LKVTISFSPFESLFLERPYQLFFFFFFFFFFPLQTKLPISRTYQVPHYCTKERKQKGGKFAGKLSNFPFENLPLIPDNCMHLPSVFSPIQNTKEHSMPLEAFLFSVRQTDLQEFEFQIFIN
jgi:hypothetical protein